MVFSPWHGCSLVISVPLLFFFQWVLVSFHSLVKCYFFPSATHLFLWAFKYPAAAGMLCTFRAGLELAFLSKVTLPVWLQFLGNPELSFPQCLWLSSVAALKQNYSSNNLKCFASINELSLPVSWDGGILVIGTARQGMNHLQKGFAALKEILTP